MTPATELAGVWRAGMHVGGCTRRGSTVSRRETQGCMRVLPSHGLPSSSLASARKDLWTFSPEHYGPNWKKFEVGFNTYSLTVSAEDATFEFAYGRLAAGSGQWFLGDEPGAYVGGSQITTRDNKPFPNGRQTEHVYGLSGWKRFSSLARAERDARSPLDFEGCSYSTATTFSRWHTPSWTGPPRVPPPPSTSRASLARSLHLTTTCSRGSFSAASRQSRNR
jgi:hypothetical protein